MPTFKFLKSMILLNRFQVIFFFLFSSTIKRNAVQRNTKYFKFMSQLAIAASELYEGWRIRVYHNISDIQVTPEKLLSRAQKLDFFVVTSVRRQRSN